MMSDGVRKYHPQALIYESGCLQILQSKCVILALIALNKITCSYIISCPTYAQDVLPEMTFCIQYACQCICKGFIINNKDTLGIMK